MKIRELNIDDRVAFYTDSEQEKPYEGKVTELYYNFKGKENAEVELENGFYYYLTDDDDWEVIY
ncbi:hypothetical protein [Staphylococcus agnetis]|uniref:hypothetical protein n=1 Tax=Staphylococcus agnetis TaxID=985762 RepID=UPI0004E4459B|nr:hypothetical protein [Staphylococcus agnetis]KFE41950.1 hypothetical protein SAGN_05995 [Staphylococcus agnetis]NJH66040.1 hypothetical protein [Staphylococcus agnetis]NJH98080.1 hypothetical protein [Staphylococcus agnetis]PTH45898.1 hypothetical protein BU587_09870 [Staphylococcus agnetis]PTH57675.1 hypothetical protein BU584_07895 [Staphylococcus agnetis]